MPGRPITRTKGLRPSRARQNFNATRDRLLALASGLDRLRPGAGDELLRVAEADLQRLVDRTLSSFPGSESRAS